MEYLKCTPTFLICSKNNLNSTEVGVQNSKKGFRLFWFHRTGKVVHIFENYKNGRPRQLKILFLL